MSMTPPPPVHRAAVQNGPSGQATVVLILGIASLICLPPLGIVAVALGVRELGRIRDGRGDTTKRGQTITGIVLGSIGTFGTIAFAVTLLASSATTN